MLQSTGATTRGGVYDFTKREADAVPNWISFLNMVFSIFGLLLLIAGIVFKLRK